MKPLSFIIITYNRAADLLELLQNIITLNNASELLQEVIIVNNKSTTDYTAVTNFIAQHNNFPFVYMEAAENLGVAKGRNFALAQSAAPIAIMLDDDAVLQNKDCLQHLITAFEQTDAAGRETAIVTFKVLYYDNLQMQVSAFPHKKFEDYKNAAFFETYYFAGGAHAVKKQVMEQLGAYPSDFFYGMEEYDLSYRIVNAGYRIVYSNKIIMLHKESPLGRKPKEEKLRMMWVNKCKVAWRYLPVKYFYSTAFMWGLQYLKETNCNAAGFIKGCRAVFKIKNTENRFTISTQTLQYLKKVKARLWY